MWRFLRLQLLANRSHRDQPRPKYRREADIVLELLQSGLSHLNHRRSHHSNRSNRRVR
jgi:hypothetical protein